MRRASLRYGAASVLVACCGLAALAQSTPETEPEAAPEPEGVTRTEMQAALEAIGQAITTLSGQIKEIQGQVVEVKEEKAVEEAATLGEIFERAIGHQDARVDGRTSAAKDRPAEKKPENTGVINTGNPLSDTIVNSIVDGTWREGLDTPQETAERSAKRRL